MMAAGDKKRSSYFTMLELEILMKSYSEYEHIFRRKSNTAAAAREREAAWEDIAARINALKSSGETRTWKQVKMKYKNIVQTVNRKRAGLFRLEGGPASPEDQILSLNMEIPEAEDIPAGSSPDPANPPDTRTFISNPDGVLYLVEPHGASELLQPEEEDEEDALSAATERDPERPIESMVVKQEEAPAPTAKINTLPVKELYRRHLIKKMKKTDKEMMFLDRQIQKADLEIEILKHQLEEIKTTK
ncbi:uncharacterized protein LOC121516593 [Cheilinus undulatus]|uniref:uncharacterized protein LOC121516593 n=1 Tax=Cheilinus undulatus TaxID=241271 RepID=UPI001BD32D74|nr:uncharacterized protein LOC121516593 [Cheilinus undulatus]